MDYYTRLGVSREATEEEIKKHYRKLAMQFHPDRNPGDKDAETTFKEVQEAYDVLSDTDKRSQYDRQGYVGRRPPTPPKPPSKKPEPKTKEDFEKERAKTEKKANPPEQDLDSIKCTFWGGGSTGRNIMVQLKLSPAEMKRGGTKFVTIKKRDLCKKCIGDGEAMRMCPACHGTRPDVGWCQTCEGIGALPDKCTMCNGEGVKEWMTEEVKITFSPNIQVGHSITILGAGEAAPRKPPGQVRVVII
jgi:molecular chaperone DnaJ